ncbi:hypothetical protein MSG28_011515 [Choristoneura fumiferana]|uniref:Uncharacterized protein n=1 Tax=Choristoneura fumiferana TaxID=7141 RepID=A0ACC0JNM7_CHOFU|nr:hypothetical protein MSG28_011515 [Choristoneura fumiferana]
MARYKKTGFMDDDAGSVSSIQLNEGVRSGGTHIRYHMDVHCWKLASPSRPEAMAALKLPVHWSRARQRSCERDETVKEGRGGEVFRKRGSGGGAPRNKENPGNVVAQL